MPSGPILTELRIRPVRGRVIDPYRGTPDEAEDDRYAPRPSDPQPLDDIVERLHRLPRVKLSRAGRRFMLHRGDDALKIAFTSAARVVSLDDMRLEGDPLLAIDVLVALLPLFGAVEIREADYRDLVDGHEPAETVAERYRTHWIERTLAKAAELRRAPPAPTPVYPASSARQRSTKMPWITVVALVIVVACAWLYEASWSRAKVGAACHENADCKSDECIPRLPQTSLHRPRSSRGDYHGIAVCTRRCGDACPADMDCVPVLESTYGGLLAHESYRCVPASWAADGAQ